MRLWRITASHPPVLLLDPRMGHAAELALQLELHGFPTHIEASAGAAQAAIEHAHFATLIVIADLHDAVGLDWLDDLTRRLTAFQLRARPLF